jgi:HSP20 family protein
MSNVPIKKIGEAEEASVALLDRFEKIFDEIRQRAFGLFEQRGSVPGRDLEDWFQAEREFFSAPPAELVEKETEYRIRLAVPGFEAKDIQVTVVPGVIVVEGETGQRSRKTEGKVLLTEFGARKLFRRLDMPSPIDVDKTTATLDKGVLHLAAAKVAPLKEKKVLVSTA